METLDSPQITFSFVAPVYNEQDGLEEFYHRLTAVANKLGEPYEIILVNDGSTDDTAGVLRRLATDDSRVRVVELSRNFGHQVAVTAGYDYACGRAVISLDADGQHPPEMIPDMVSRWREGFEVVYTVRRDTKGIRPLRRGIGRLMYRLIRSSSGADLTDQADFRLLDRKALEALKTVREQARFVRGLVRWIGFRQVGIPYTAQKRIAGKSNYSFKQLMRMSTAGVYNFSSRPLRMAPAIGTFLVVAAVIYAAAAVIYALAVAAFNLPWVPWPWWLHVMAAMVAMFGVQFLLFGVMGEYIARIFDQTKGRPLYIVREKIGFPKPSGEEEEAQKQELAPRERFSVFT